MHGDAEDDTTPSTETEHTMEQASTPFDRYIMEQSGLEPVSGSFSGFWDDSPELQQRLQDAALEFRSHTVRLASFWVELAIKTINLETGLLGNERRVTLAPEDQLAVTEDSTGTIMAIIRISRWRQGELRSTDNDDDPGHKRTRRKRGAGLRRRIRR